MAEPNLPGYSTAAVVKAALDKATTALQPVDILQAPLAPEVGDYWADEGGVYVGNITSSVDGKTYAIIDMGAQADSVARGAGLKTWGGSGTFIAETCGAPPASMDDGKANCDAISVFASGDLTDYPALDWINSINAAGVNGFSDLYIPSRDESELLYRALKPSTTDNTVGLRVASANCGEDGLDYGVSSSTHPLSLAHTAEDPAQTSILSYIEGTSNSILADTYWTSSESTSTSALYQRFNNGVQVRAIKTASYRVRGIRRVDITKLYRESDRTNVLLSWSARPSSARILVWVRESVDVGYALVKIVTGDTVSTSVKVPKTLIDIKLVAYHSSGFVVDMAFNEVNSATTQAVTFAQSVSLSDYPVDATGVTDATASIQAVIDGSDSAVFVPAGQYLINPDVGVFPKTGIALLFAPGASFIASASSSDGLTAIINNNNVIDVLIIDAKAVGERDIHNGTTGEYGMGIKIFNSSVKVIDSTITNCWGDGLYIGGDDNSANVGIRLHNCATNSNRRNGISLICGSDVLISECAAYDNNGTPPNAGLDIEPNYATNVVSNIRVVNFTTGNNGGSGVSVGLGALESSSTPFSVEIVNHVDNGSDMGIILSRGNDADGLITFSGSWSDNATQQVKVLDPLKDGRWYRYIQE